MISKSFTALAVATVMAAACVLPGVSDAATVIVMPARTRVVQLAFQVARVKDVGLVAYNNSPSLAAPLIHVWNGREWVQIGVDEYVSGTFLPSGVDHLFVLGDSTSLPAAMAGDPKWAAHVHKTADLNVASLLNVLGPVLKFSSSEWRWLAEQNGLEITDRNADRRRYGRWGKSGTDATFRPPPSPIGEVAPQPPMTDIKEPTLPLTTPAAKVEVPKEPAAVAPVPAVTKVPEAPKAAEVPKVPEVPKAAKAVPVEAQTPAAPVTPDAVLVPITPVPAVNAPAAEPSTVKVPEVPKPATNAPAATDPTRK